MMEKQKRTENRNKRNKKRVECSFSFFENPEEESEKLSDEPGKGGLLFTVLARKEMKREVGQEGQRGQERDQGEGVQEGRRGESEWEKLCQCGLSEFFTDPPQLLCTFTI
jgi:hypothetical protein